MSLFPKKKVEYPFNGIFVFFQNSKTHLFNSGVFVKWAYFQKVEKLSRSFREFS